ncbi:hypothetical protein DIS24_g10313 [Lasiodiplodia hormozganensis]|uniref:Uncharacterized protein n=1 Tax=Lasiodiplodia hormozganensis TaxID=869390 RepID=A0AA39XQJ8_9PEZI|nr:hypothetical protein DIS24_g10313 [Lasiodiplodia hormozganensis]
MASPEKASEAPLALNPTHVCGDGNGIFQLNLPSMQGIYCLEVLTYDTERSLTFACNVPISLERPETASSPYLFPKLDLIDALRSGLLELVEQNTQQVVQLPPTAYSPSVGHVDIPPHPRPGHTQAIIFIVFDTTAKIWKGILHPYKKYNLRLSASGDPSQGSGLPVRRDPGIIHFTVYNDPVPPTCSAVFSLASPVCHRSGTPQFKFITEITLDASDAAKGPVTVGLYDEPFNTDKMGCASEYIRFVDTETGEEVYFPHVRPCWGELIPTPPDFPADDFFVELWPDGKSWRHEYTLELEEQYRDSHGGLEFLKLGKKYRAELSSNLKYGFAMWMHGRKEDLLRGTAEEKRERWAPGPRGRPAISIRQLNEPVEFDVVD